MLFDTSTPTGARADERLRGGIARLGTDPAGFALDDAAAIRITPTRGRAWGL